MMQIGTSLALPLPGVRNTLSLSTAAPRSDVQEHANGVRTWTEGSTDVYELPVGVDAVPRRITVEHRSWWRGGDAVQAFDAAGAPMNVREYDSVMYVTDARTGVTTRLNGESLDLSVCAPVQSKTREITNGKHTISSCELEEHLSASGDIRIRTNHRVEEQTAMYSMVRDMPANCSIVIQHDEDYEELRLRPTGEEPRMQRWHEQKHQEPENLGEVPARIDQSGDLFVPDAEGNEQVFHLFIPPHVLARQAP